MDPSGRLRRGHRRRSDLRRGRRLLSLAGHLSQPVDLSFISSFRLLHRPLPVRPSTYISFAHAAAKQPMYNHSRQGALASRGPRVQLQPPRGSARRSWDHGPSNNQLWPASRTAGEGRKERGVSDPEQPEGRNNPPNRIQGEDQQKGRNQLGNPVGGGALGRCTGGLPVGCRLSPGSPPPPGRYPIPTATLRGWKASLLHQARSIVLFQRRGFA